MTLVAFLGWLKEAISTMQATLFQTKAELPENNDARCFFGMVKGSYLNYASHLKVLLHFEGIYFFGSTKIQVDQFSKPDKYDVSTCQYPAT